MTRPTLSRVLASGARDEVLHCLFQLVKREIIRVENVAAAVSVVLQADHLGGTAALGADDFELVDDELLAFGQNQSQTLFGFQVLQQLFFLDLIGVLVNDHDVSLQELEEDHEAGDHPENTERQRGGRTHDGFLLFGMQQTPQTRTILDDQQERPEDDLQEPGFVDSFQRHAEDDGGQQHQGSQDETYGADVQNKEGHCFSF